MSEWAVIYIQKHRVTTVYVNLYIVHVQDIITSDRSQKVFGAE